MPTPIDQLKREAIEGLAKLDAALVELAKPLPRPEQRKKEAA